VSGLSISENILAALIRHARENAPLEACGMLAGRDGKVLRFHPMTNADNSPEHFTLVPTEQFAVAKQIRADGHEALAVYHSHPASPARPSEEDIRLAFAGDILYVILSLMDPGRPVVRGFRIEDGRTVHIPITFEPGDEE